MSKTNKAAFGSSQKKFDRICLHPALDLSGLYSKRPKACDPCLYHPKDIREVFPITKKKLDKDPWRYKKELEEWAKCLGYRNQKILDSRKWLNSILGPAWYEISEPPKYIAACMNVGFGRTPRMRASKNYNPGPGTYYQGQPFKAPFSPHSTRPTFEREEPCRFKDPSPKWSLAPDRYVIVDKDSIEQKSKRIVSLRGPYDLFTGKRDMSTIKNHFNTSRRMAASTWPLKLKGCLETYKKSHFGTMNKTNRSKPDRGRTSLVDLAMCLRKPDDPGAAHYNIDKLKVFKQNKRGFNSSYDRPPGYQRVVVWPGVGRYNVAKDHDAPGHGHKHAFLSKEQRTIGAIIPEPMNSF